MRLRVELSVDDLVAFSLHHHQSSPTLKRSRVWAVIAIVVMTATLSHIAGELLRNPLLRLLGIAAAFFLGGGLSTDLATQVRTIRAAALSRRTESRSARNALV